MNILTRIFNAIFPRVDKEADAEAYSSLRSIIVAELYTSSEDQEHLPRGTYSAIARRRGCTTSYVSRIAKEEGFTVGPASA